MYKIRPVNTIKQRTMVKYVENCLWSERTLAKLRCAKSLRLNDGYRKKNPVVAMMRLSGTMKSTKNRCIFLMVAKSFAISVVYQKGYEGEMC